MLEMLKEAATLVSVAAHQQEGEQLQAHKFESFVSEVDLKPPEEERGWDP